jgi:carbon-monoxide dehydrogenase large subunit
MKSSEIHQQVGKKLLRKEDVRFLTGHGKYIDDIQITNCWHAAFIRSPHAHAKINGIDASAALELDGVMGVYTGHDLVKLTTSLKMAPPIDGLKPVEMTTLPIDKVLFQGDLVACVIAKNRYLAEDAIDLIDVQYIPLSPVTSLAQAQEPNAPLVIEGLKTNLLSHQFNQTGYVDLCEKQAFKVIHSTFSQHRQTHLPMETRGCIAIWDEGSQHLNFHVGTQAPHPYRTQLANRLNLTESQVTIHSPDIGGAFGQKIVLYREELTVAALAKFLNHAIRWREDRLENLVGSSQAREDYCTTKVSVDDQGKILGLDFQILEDFGAYSFYPGNYLARVVAMILTGPYKIANYRYDVKVFLTNKVGNAPMRAPMSVTSWVMEGTMDAIARELGLDPVAVRKINLVSKEEMPYVMPTGEILSDVTPLETLDGALDAIDYAGFSARKKQSFERNKYRGIGICNVIESTTYGSAFYKAAGIPGSGHEAVWIRIEPTGVINASVGLGPSGQGYETAFSQVIAEGLGVAPSQIRILMGNSDIAPYGMGSRGARGGTAGGGAFFLCALQAHQKLMRIAAHLLNITRVEDLKMIDGVVHCLNDGDFVPTQISLRQLSQIAYFEPTRLPPNEMPGLEFHLTYDPPPMTYSNSTHICELEIDPITGALTIDRYVVAEDCGTVLNPQIVEGQQHGAIAMGISGVLLEEVIYDTNGQNITGTLADYLIATCGDLPKIEILHMNTPNQKTPLGIKGMAEGGVMGAIGAVMNAANSALSDLNIQVNQQPLSPMYLRRLIRQAT